MLKHIYLDVSGFMPVADVRQYMQKAHELLDVVKGDKVVVFELGYEIRPYGNYTTFGGSDVLKVHEHAQKAGIDLAVIITDGYLDRYIPKDPAKWIFLILEDGVSSAVPEGSLWTRGLLSQPPIRKDADATTAS